MLYQIVLIIFCVGFSALCYFLTPSPDNALPVSIQIALGDILLSGKPFLTNNLIAYFTTIQTILFSLCANVLCHRLTRFWMTKPRGDHPVVTPAMFGAVFRNIIQLLKQVVRGFDNKVAIITAVILLNQIDAYWSSVVAVANTSLIPNAAAGLLGQNEKYKSLGLTASGLSAFVSGFRDVTQACDSTATLVNCINGELDCTYKMDVFADYFMNCSYIPPATAAKGRLLTKQVESRLDLPTIRTGVLPVQYSGPPILTWSIIETSTFLNDNNSTSATMKCSIYTAWAQRTESSTQGTMSKNVIHTYDSFSTSHAFVSTASTSCLGVATPFCMLQLIQIGLTGLGTSANNADTRNINSNFYFLTTITDPSTTMIPQDISNNKLMAYRFQQEMRFTVERMYKQLLSVSLRNETAQVCTSCTVQTTQWVANKIAFMVVVLRPRSVSKNSFWPIYQ
ncbi:hypothetical protein BCR33DRAFT_794019 [Rhizoclosmatium globosum]|uniref:Uncharacterized protein n=1 Tax=Rhizoclosmatium globosum TaxID=329046 RepID=A0A1Y2AWV9_9FUNG|nr:hypothetical protein BCR33DRAFT_794019 [Rhizoclosmatium globosum]|eukprot:ORY27059.1 hypothetical protein BCR33DRAFT_794019 [Rhizoclosmatium globosum]